MPTRKATRSAVRVRSSALLPSAWAGVIPVTSQAFEAAKTATNTGSKLTLYSGVVPSPPFGPLDSSRRHEKLAALQINSTRGT
jgi:hypothetical protein